MSSPSDPTSGQIAIISASGQIVTGQGTLQKLICSASTSGTVTLYDGIGAGGSAFTTAFPVTAGGVYNLEVNFQVGLYVTLGGTATITATYSR